MNATDHKCLMFLSQGEGVTAGQLAELTGLTTGAVTSIIDRFQSIYNSTMKLLSRYSEQELKVILDFLQASNQMSMQEIERFHGKD